MHVDVQQVATAYFHLRSLDEQLSIATQTLKARQDSGDLTRKLESRGSVPLSDLRQAEELEYAASVQVPGSAVGTTDPAGGERPAAPTRGKPRASGSY